MKTPITSQGLPPYIYGWEVGPNEKVWNEAAVREALAAQAATIEAICKIIECAGPEAAGEIADLLGYPSVEWPSDQAASSPATAVMQVGCENIDGTLNIHPETETCSICEPAQAVDAVDEREAGHVGDTRFEGWLSESVHKGSMYLKQDMRDSYWAGYQERAALQAARQPQAQQGVAAPLELKVCHSQNASQTPQADLSLVTAPQEWSPAYTRGQTKQSAPVAAVPALVTDAALIRELVDHIERNTCTHEGTHRGGAIWEVCDSCGARWADDEGGKPEFKWPAVVEKARAILALRPERVPLTEEQMVSAVRPLCNTDQVAERLVAVSIDEYRAIEAASAKLNDLAVGDGAQPIKDTP